MSEESYKILVACDQKDKSRFPSSHSILERSDFDLSYVHKIKDVEERAREAHLIFLYDEMEGQCTQKFVASKPQTLGKRGVYVVHKETIISISDGWMIEQKEGLGIRLPELLEACLGILPRGGPRFPVQLEIKAGKHDDSGEEKIHSRFNGTAHAINENGLLMETEHDLKVGDTVLLKLVGLHGGAEHVTSGVVLRQVQSGDDASKLFYALAFREVSEPVRVLIRTHLD